MVGNIEFAGTHNARPRPDAHAIAQFDAAADDLSLTGEDVALAAPLLGGGSFGRTLVTL